MIFRRNSENHTQNWRSEYVPRLLKALFSPGIVLSCHKALIHFQKLIPHVRSSSSRTPTNLCQQGPQNTVLTLAGNKTTACELKACPELLFLQNNDFYAETS